MNKITKIVEEGDNISRRTNYPPVPQIVPDPFPHTNNPLKLPVKEEPKQPVITPNKPIVK